MLEQLVCWKVRRSSRLLFPTRSYILLTANNLFCKLFWTDTVFIFKVSSVASNSYENIDAVQGVDFAMNAAKILEKTLSYAAVYIAGLYY